MTEYTPQQIAAILLVQPGRLTENIAADVRVEKAPRFQEPPRNKLTDSFAAPAIGDQDHEDPRSLYQAMHELANMGYKSNEVKTLYLQMYCTVMEELQRTRMRSLIPRTQPVSSHAMLDVYCFMGTKIQYKMGRENVTSKVQLDWTDLEKRVHTRLALALEALKIKQPSLFLRTDNIVVQAPENVALN